MKNITIKAIRCYQKHISPYFKKSCRFLPSCSEYAVNAIEQYGLFRGAIYAFWRILRCNPFSPGGYDPIITNKQNNRGKVIWKKD
ncbi:MAG: membrane protein insertion efficiency factor YidD [Candidatus Omnitrophota bacterium]